MRIDKKYKKKLLTFIHTHDNNHVNMAQIGLELNFYKGSLDDTASLIIKQEEFDKFINTIRFLSDLGLVKPSNEKLGISDFQGKKSVNPKTTFSIPAAAHEQVEMIIEPWWKTASRKVLETSGKLIWIATGVAIAVPLTSILNNFLGVCL